MKSRTCKKFWEFQGSVRAIVDAALVQQFKAYLAAKDLIYEELDEASQEDESQKFLSEKYPGSKQPPNQMIELMTSPSAQKALQAQSIVNPEETKTCQITAKKRRKRATSCPDGTWHMTNFGCFKFFNTQLNRVNAYNKCQALNSQAILPILKTDHEFQTFFEDLKGGIFSDFNLQTSTFWMQAQKSPTDNYFVYDDGSLATNVNYLQIDYPIGTGPCAIAQLIQTSPPKFSLDAESCESKSEFFCVIHDNIVVTTGTTTPAPTTPVAPVNATPILPKFPCKQDSRKKRNAAENQSIEKLDLLLNPEMKSQREAKIQNARQNYQNNFGDLDLEKSYENLFEILWYSQLPCFDVQNVTSNLPYQMSVIKNCAWKGLDINCSAIFKTLPTDRGMCCTFNMERAEKIFKESKYSQMVQKMQDTDAHKR